MPFYCPGNWPALNMTCILYAKVELFLHRAKCNADALLCIFGFVILIYYKIMLNLKGEHVHLQK